MPNLKNFIFKVFSQTDEVTYKQLIEKLLSSNIILLIIFFIRVEIMI